MGPRTATGPDGAFCVHRLQPGDYQLTMLTRRSRMSPVKTSTVNDAPPWDRASMQMITLTENETQQVLTEWS
jgi:hypothetical protein